MDELIEEKKKKRGRRKKNERREYELNREQTKFFIDLSNEKENLDLIFNLLEVCNQKSYGREVIFKDIALFGLQKINEKDFEKIRDTSLSKMEKVQRNLDEYNTKNGTSLSMGEYLVKKLNIN